MVKVSIITVSYNSGKTIEDTIKSVTQQSYSNIEYIIVDGDSSDNTKEIVEAHRAVISKFISEKDHGIYDAMNKGILQATGDIVGILNSDDIYYDDLVIAKVVDAFGSDKELACVYGNIVYFRGNINNIIRIWKTKAYTDQFFELGEVPPHPAVFFRKDVYDKIGLYKTDYRISGDLEFMIRVLKLHRLRSQFVNEFFVKMRAGGVSTKGLKSYLISTKEIRKAWNSNGFTYPFSLYFVRPIKKVLQLLKL